jgi:hypothetical protein
MYNIVLYIVRKNDHSAGKDTEEFFNLLKRFHSN